MAVQQDTVLAVPFHGAGQNLALGVLSDGGERLNTHAVINTRHVLLNDGTLVQICRHVVGGGTDQLHAPIVGLVIGACPFETGQEAVVDVDGFAVQGASHRVG